MSAAPTFQTEPRWPAFGRPGRGWISLYGLAGNPFCRPPLASAGCHPCAISPMTIAHRPQPHSSPAHADFHRQWTHHRGHDCGHRFSDSGPSRASRILRSSPALRCWPVAHQHSRFLPCGTGNWMPAGLTNANAPGEIYEAPFCFLK